MTNIWKDPNDREFVLCLRVKKGEKPVIPGCIRRPCGLSPKRARHYVWVAPSTQTLLGRAAPICENCLRKKIDRVQGRMF